MDGVTHRTVSVNGISMHVAEKGEGPVVLLLHGFPELWYSWRHQLAGLAAAGYRAVAPDLRGYGDTDAPPSAESYTVLHIVGDVAALIHSLGQDQVFVVGHDWGAIIAWYLCLLRPDLVKALVNLSVPFRLWDHERKPTDHFRSLLGDDFYICRFQAPGVVEAQFARLSSSLLLKKIYTNRDPSPLGFGGPPRAEIVLPSWLSEEDINYVASKFDESGYTGALNYYRALDLSSELLAPWRGAQVKVPVKFIMGELDLTLNFPGVKDYLHNGSFKKDVPLLKDVVIVEGVGHFINQEIAHEITDHILEFIKKF